VEEHRVATEPVIEQPEIRGHVSVRVDRATYDRLVELAREQHIAIGRVIARAVDNYDRISMAEESNAAYARLRMDPAAWADWQAELSLWDATVMDGLEADE
jgi:predicted DNA-binding ribbon-helix-helix protein